MCLRFVFLLTTRLTAWLRLARREEAWKTAEILILRHQLAVLQRRQPRRPNLDWADRALLATLLAVIPKARRQALRLLVTPDTVLRWHRDILRRRWAARSKRGRTGRPATRRTIKALARVSEIRSESGVFSLVGWGSGGGFGVLPTSASGGVAGEAEDAGEFVLDGAGFGEHAVGSGPAAVAVVEQDGLADAGELA